MKDAPKHRLPQKLADAFVATQKQGALSAQVEGGFPQLTMLPFLRTGDLIELHCVQADPTFKALRQNPKVAFLVSEYLGVFEGYETTVSFGFVAPGGTPPAVIARLHDAAAKVLADKELQAKLTAQGFDLLPIGTPGDYAAQIKADIAKWVPIVKASGATTN